MKNLLFLPVVVLLLTGCNKPQETPTPQPIKDITQEVAPTETTDYVKPEGWKTMESTEYGFQVDYPDGWVPSPGGSRIGTYNRKFISVTSSESNSKITFNIYHQDVTNGKPYTDIPFEEQFLPLTDNQDMIDKWGEAFRYFRDVYSKEVQDELVQLHIPLSERTAEDYLGDNYAIVIIDEHSITPEEDLATIKTVIKSFRMP